MNPCIEYNKWLNEESLDEFSRADLKSLHDNPGEIEDRFYRKLSFGTGGIRGVNGAGTNRVNVYVVRLFTQGLANFLSENPIEGKEGVAIAYDSRNYSENFAMEAALVLCAAGIRTYLFDELRPTPELSYAVRKLNCRAGIVITASHNSYEYNGYKVYGPDGGQITPETADEITLKIDNLDIFRDIVKTSREEAVTDGLLVMIGHDIDKQYIEDVISLSLRKDIISRQMDLRIVYTPLHGAGLRLVTGVLEKLGARNVFVVKEQEEPDGDFPTVKSPNPEEREALALGIDLAKETDADIVFGTDPDSDRVGVAVRADDGEYKVLTGNQIGALLTHYMVSSKKNICRNDVVIKTIVTSDLGAEIARSYGASVINTLTGFKFIGEKIKEYETGDNRFLLGYEESYGYLAGDFVRDKDAIIASMLIVEMTAYYKSLGVTLWEALTDLYKEYGFYVDSLDSYVLKGIDGKKQINEIVGRFRDLENLSDTFDGLDYVEDYMIGQRIFMDGRESEPLGLPEADVVKAYLGNRSWFAVRPSGTEPKLKVYCSVMDESLGKASKILEKLKSDINGIVSLTITPSFTL